MTCGMSESDPVPADRPLRIFLVAIEESADRLGANLMQALRDIAGPERIQFRGVGGRKMSSAGLAGLYPVDDLSIVGFASIPQLLPTILRRLRQTSKAIKAWSPDVLVLIDAPTYNLPLARRTRRANPDLPIVQYVAPPVWAWRFNRAPAMRNHVDLILALLPFEPGALQDLGGPPCRYVGHPLVEETNSLRPNPAETERRLADPPLILALLGSRSDEVKRLAPVFGEAIGLLAAAKGPLQLVAPTLPALRQQVSELTANWPIRPIILTTDHERQAAIRTARAALTKCGTATLELALGGVPMVAVYKFSPFEAFFLRRLVRASAFALPNLILRQQVVPEIIHDGCTPQRLASQLAPLLGDTQERRTQTEAFAELDQILEIATTRPGRRAAGHVLDLCRTHGGR